MGSLKGIALQYGWSLWRRRWHAIGVAWAVCAVGWLFIARMPNEYESSARIYLNPDQTLNSLLHGISVDNDVVGRLERMQHTLLSVSNMKNLIRMTDLEAQVKDATDTERLVNRLQQAIEIKPQTRNLFTISYRDSNPRLAQSVVSNLLSLFMESSAGDSRTDINSAQRFVQTQLDRLETELRAAEHKKSDFQTKYYDLLPSGESGLSLLEQARATVQHLNEDLVDAIAQRDSLQKQIALIPLYDSAAETSQAGNAGFSLSPRTRLAQLTIQLETAKATMTDQHPVVVALQHQIDAAKAAATAAETGGEAGKPVTTSAGITNPLYREMKIKLVDQETKIASIRRRLVSAEEDRDRIEDEARRAPSVGAEYMNIDRDYEVIKKNYEELLSRRESAEIAENADKKGDKLDIRTIDTPEVPTIPVAPNRLLFYSMVLVAGIGAGIGVAFVMTQIDSSYSTTTALQALGVPILGSISLAEDFDHRPRRWLFSGKVFAAVCLMLVFVYCGLLLTQTSPQELVG